MPFEREQAFEINHDGPPGDVLLCGFSEYGLAGLTAADYLSTQLELAETGNITATEMPAITPFQNGRPRHHTRLFSGDGPISVLVGELFVPRPLAGQFADALIDWAEGSIEEVVVLSGVPIAHGPDDHRAFYVATDDYRERRLTDTEIPPMGGGFLDGVNAALVQRGLQRPPGVGVFATPAHPQNPDIEAALRLLGAVERTYDLGVDTEPLESFAAEVQRHYADLAERMQSIEESRQSEDRMYM